jgi:hypothetical protein
MSSTDKINNLDIELKLMRDALQAEGLEPYWQNTGGGCMVLCVEAPSTPDGEWGEWGIVGEDDWACEEKINLHPRLSYLDQGLWDDDDNVWVDAYMIELPEILTEPYHVKHYAQLIAEFLRGTVTEPAYKTWRICDTDRCITEGWTEYKHWTQSRTGECYGRTPCPVCARSYPCDVEEWSDGEVPGFERTCNVCFSVFDREGIDSLLQRKPKPPQQGSPSEGGYWSIGRSGKPIFWRD